MTQISISEVLELKTFRGDKGEGYIVHYDDNHWDRAFRIPDKKLIGMCSESVFCLSENPKGLTLPKQNMKSVISGKSRVRFKNVYGVPTTKTIYMYSLERHRLAYRLYWIIDDLEKYVYIFEFKSRKALGKELW